MPKFKMGHQNIVSSITFCMYSQLTAIEWQVSRATHFCTILPKSTCFVLKTSSDSTWCSKDSKCSSRLSILYLEAQINHLLQKELLIISFSICQIARNPETSCMRGNPAGVQSCHLKDLLCLGATHPNHTSSPLARVSPKAPHPSQKLYKECHFPTCVDYKKAS